MNKIFPYILVASAIIGVSSIIYSALTHKSQVILSGQMISVDIAETDYSREKGLSGRRELPDNQGMLFIFSTPGQYGFWMKDMNFPIDIVWFDQYYTVVHLEKSVATSTYPTIFTPEQNALYVLEIPAGEADKLGLTVGSKADFVLK